MHMQTANGSSQELAGCLEMLEIEVEGIKSWAHAYVVPDAPYRLLLGRPWQKLIKLSKYEDTNDVYITIWDPLKSSNIRTVATSPRPWPHPSLALTAAAISTVPRQPVWETIGCASLPTSAADIYSMIKSFGSKTTGCASLPMSTADIYSTIKSFGSKTTGCASLPTSVVDIYSTIKSSTSPIPDVSSKNPQGRSISTRTTSPPRILKDTVFSIRTTSPPRILKDAVFSI